MYSAKELAEYCEGVLKFPSVYGWGGLMRIVSDDYIRQLYNMYPDKYSNIRRAYLNELKGRSYICDCVGLIKSFIFGGVGSPNYDMKYDINTSGFLMLANKVGKAEDVPEIKGLIMYMPGHVGVYVGGGKVIECTLSEYGDGIVKTNLHGRGWTNYLMLPYTIWK